MVEPIETPVIDTQPRLLARSIAALDEFVFSRTWCKAPRLFVRASSKASAKFAPASLERVGVTLMVEEGEETLEIKGCLKLLRYARDRKRVYCYHFYPDDSSSLTAVQFRGQKSNIRGINFSTERFRGTLENEHFHSRSA